MALNNRNFSICTGTTGDLPRARLPGVPLMHGTERATKQRPAGTRNTAAAFGTMAHSTELAVPGV